MNKGEGWSLSETAESVCPKADVGPHPRLLLASPDPVEGSGLKLEAEKGADAADQPQTERKGGAGRERAVTGVGETGAGGGALAAAGLCVKSPPG